MLFKKTQIKDCLVTIKRNLASFIVLSVLFAAAISMFCGAEWSAISSELSLNKILEDGNTPLLIYTFPYGASEDDMKSLIEGHDDLKAEGFNIEYRTFTFEGNKYQSKIFSLMSEISTPIVLEGKLPQNENEIAVKKYWAELRGLEIGDTITLDKGASLLNPLKNETFTVTALIEMSDNALIYEDTIGFSTDTMLPVNVTLYVTDDAFNKLYTNGYSTVALYSEEYNKKNFNTEEYKQHENDLKAELETKAQQIYEKGFNYVKAMYSQYPAEMLNGLEIRDTGFYVTKRSDNTATSIMNFIVSIFGSVRYSLTALFILVSAFVAYSTVSRMVHDHTKLIGTKSANGMTRREIFSLYLAFNLLALIIGGILSYLISFLYAYVIDVAIGSVFVCDFNVICLGFKEFALIFGLLLVFVTLISILSVSNILKLSVTKQLAGEMPPVGKNRFYERFKFWKKLPLLSKTIVNNFFNDKRRVAGTILGITGATAIIVASFTFPNLILNSYDTQFEDYYHFTHNITCTRAENHDNIESILEKYNCKYAAMNVESMFLQKPNGTWLPVAIYSYEDPADFSSIINLENRQDEKLGKGLYITHAFEKQFNAQKGHKTSLKFYSGEEQDIVIDDFFKCYLFESLIYCDSETYEERVGRDFAVNTYFIDIGDADYDALVAELKTDDTFFSIGDYHAMSAETFAIVKYVLIAMKVVFLAMAIGMTFMVLKNLIVMYIAEKKKDLIVILINGYDVPFAKKYIYSDTIALSVIGWLLGSVIGEIFGNITSNAFSTANCRFEYGIDWPSILYAAAVVAVIVTLVCIKQLKAIERFKLSDINS